MVIICAIRVELELKFVQNKKIPTIVVCLSLTGLTTTKREIDQILLLTTRK